MSDARYSRVSGSGADTGEVDQDPHVGFATCDGFAGCMVAQGDEPVGVWTRIPKAGSADPTNRYAVLHRIATVTKAETRARKIGQYAEMLGRGEKVHPTRPTSTTQVRSWEPPASQ